MRKIVTVTSLTLDGVMQAPGRADEDRRGGFEHGGWARPYNDPVMAQVMGEGMGEGGPLLFGRRTYEDFAAVWPARKGNPFTEVLDKALGIGPRRDVTFRIPRGTARRKCLENRHFEAGAEGGTRTRTGCPTGS